MIKYDDKSIYIIGSLSNRTWIVDPTNGFQIKKGPSLNIKRKGHGCAKMTLQGRTILVVAGGMGSANRRSGYLTSVEILDPTKNEKWTIG